MIKHSYLFFILSLCLTFDSFAFFVRDAAHDNTDDEARANVQITNDEVSGARTSLFTEGTNGTDTSSAVNVYVPIRSSENDDYTYYRSGGNTFLVEIDFDTVLTTGSGNVTNAASLYFTIDVDVDATNDRLVAAVLNDDTYDVIGSDLDSDAVDAENLLVNIAIDDLCDISETLECRDFDTDGESSSTEKTATVAIFVTSQTGNAISASDVQNATFYKILLSNESYDDEEFKLNSITKGENQIFFNYTGFSMSNIESVYGIALETSVPSDCSTDTATTLASIVLPPPSSGTGLNLDGINDLNTVKIEAESKIKGLTNGTCYQIRALQCDKYGFCSNVSNQIDGTPEVVLSLLTKNGCFFFTAGFGRDHHIIEFFKKFRDEVLRKNFFGKSFVKFYYQVGPKYAPWLLDKPWAQKIVQIIAYVLYAFINYIQLFVLMLVALVSFCVFKVLRKRGVKIYGRS